MLALLLALLLSAGLLARGAVDLWVQSGLFILVVGSVGAWLAGRIAIGYVPVPTRKLLAWTCLLAALAFLSARASPVSVYAIQSWRVVFLGLLVFCVTSVASKDDRAAVDQVIRATAWALMLLAVYQHWHDGMSRPAAALLNENVFAGAILLLLPLAVQQRDWLLCAGLLVCLCWARSVGAWLGLSAALVITRRGRESIGNYVGLGLMFICLVALYAKLQSPEVFNRWRWWSAAWRMAAAHPWSGFGPGSYSYAGPAFSAPETGLSTLYAHEHFLETAAELGWPYLWLWLGGLAYFLRRGESHNRFGALAVLTQSLWDYPLSVPGVFWLFCYCVASTTPQTSTGINVRFERKAPWAAAAALATLTACWWAGRSWKADRLRAQAMESYQRGAATEKTLGLLENSLAVADDPAAERAVAELILSSTRPLTQDAAKAAAGHLLISARQNPYRPSTWAALERLHAALGDAEAVRRLRAERETFRPLPATGAGP